jgi:hypothetical protein
MLGFSPKRLVLSCAFLTLPQLATAFTTDGSGHYALRFENQTNPGMSTGSGLHQAFAQSFRLLGEVRANDRASFFMEMRLFKNNGSAYLGDTAQPPQCSEYGSGSNDCITDTQDVRYPGYAPIHPYLSKAYARYAADYFILEAGRRGRNWGLGILLDAGEEAFAPSASVFDGVSLDVNLQNPQALGFSVGYDQLAQTGAPVRPPEKNADVAKDFGPPRTKSDTKQAFLSVEYDDRRLSAGAPFSKQIGLYASRTHSGPVDKGGSDTELTLFDVYANLRLKSVFFKQEMVIALGKSADPSLVKLGGNYYDKNGEPAANSLNTMALAGTLGWTFAESGSYSGPAEYLQGDHSEHVVFANYAYAPGDQDGYYNDRRTNESDAQFKALNIGRRSGNKAGAFALHRNFRPALILFNGRDYTHHLAVDGVFDPGQFMNAQLYSLGYRYDSLVWGQVEFQTIYARLNETMQQDVKAYYAANPELRRPIGFGGNTLGVELDLTYTKKINRNFNCGIGTGYLITGNAWKTEAERSPANSMLGQMFLGFQF